MLVPRESIGLASVVMGLSASLVATAAMPGAWERVEDVDRTNEESTVGFVIEGETVTLSVACMPTPVVSFSLSDSGMFETVKWKKARVRFDDEMSISPRLFRSGDLILPDYPGTPRSEFLLAMLEHQRLFVKLPLQRGGAIKENFIIGGLGDLLEGEPLCTVPGESHEAPPWVGALPESGPLIAGVGDVTNPTLIRKSRVSPDYPDVARRKRLEGTVILEAKIDEEGRVTDLWVMRTNQPGVGFEEAAMRAVRKWRYEPATRQGVPVEVVFIIFIEFKLH